MIVPFVPSEDEPTFVLDTSKGQAECWEIAEQPYADMRISAGMVAGIEPDTLYFRLVRDGEEPLTILLRPDEMAAIVWVCSGALWSQTVLDDEDSDEQESR